MQAASLTPHLLQSIGGIGTRKKGRIRASQAPRTKRGSRRRRIGEALTAHVVRRGGQLGCRLSVLQASAMGKPVYERMGYRQVREYRTYHRSRK